MINNLFKVKYLEGGIKLYTPSKFADERGEIWTVFKSEYFDDKIKFNHDRVTYAYKNTLRGFHGDKKTWKLISCLYGEVYCVIINYDKKSKNYLKKYEFKINNKNKKIIIVPPNMLLGWCCLSKECLFMYKMSYRGQYVDHKDQITIRWDDDKLNVKWPVKKPILSKRDRDFGKKINYFS